jgi:glycosyltransferase involved in cell wall biosynthesis
MKAGYFSKRAPHVSHSHSFMSNVSVIIPNYNGARFLREAIDSALSQEGVEVEVIVVDDGSTDDSRTIIESYGCSIRSVFQENSGACAARNAGLALASAPYVLFLDSDDQLYPDALMALAAQLSVLGAGSAVYGHARWMSSPAGVMLLHDDSCLPSCMSPPAALIGQNLLTGRVLHWVDNLHKVGGFDIDLPRGQEFDLHFRLALYGVVFEPLDQDVLYYRVHDTPGRISACGFSGGDPDDLLRLNDKHMALLDQSYGSNQWPDQVRVRMAQRLWDIGRGLVRERAVLAANSYFEKAREISPKNCVAGNCVIRLATRLLGPVWAEALLMAARKLIRPSDSDV